VANHQIGGGVLASFTEEEKESFNQQLQEAIKNHGKRSYDEGFRKEIRSILQRFGKKVRQNSCSKHWFYDYLKKNNKVRKTWETIVGQPLPDEEDSMSQTTDTTTDGSHDQIEEEEEEEEELSVLPLTTITYEKIKIQVKMEEEDEKQSLSTAPSECEHLVDFQYKQSWLTEECQDWNFQKDFTPADIYQCEFHLPQSKIN